MRMHYHIEVVTDEKPTESDIDDLFEHSYFDYWKIGGRWSTSHTDDPLDNTIPVENIPENLDAYAVINDKTAIYLNEENGFNLCGALWSIYEDGDRDIKVKDILEKHNITTGYVTTVDCHW
jgi:hypothetical protein